QPPIYWRALGLAAAKRMAVLGTIVGVLLTATVANAGIYPDDHWDHATELTAETADAWVQEKVDAGQTALIRWIASEG
ncbi:unnamed protein product, partial [Prorocentrum cordatum]